MKILDAMEIIDCDFEHVDFEVLVGALLQLKRWDEHYGELRKKGKRSMFDTFRLDGEKAIKSYREEMERDEADDSDRLIGGTSGKALCAWAAPAKRSRASGILAAVFKTLPHYLS
ncbi:TPA: hypothetical protein RUM00_004759 [Escherichia coli]|nr:hypothetical protein [Escherichia coli]